jgi:hypothetical protein
VSACAYIYLRWPRPNPFQLRRLSTSHQPSFFPTGVVFSINTGPARAPSRVHFRHPHGRLLAIGWVGALVHSHQLNSFQLRRTLFIRYNLKVTFLIAAADTLCRSSSIVTSPKHNDFVFLVYINSMAEGDFNQAPDLDFHFLLNTPPDVDDLFPIDGVFVF